MNDPRGTVPVPAEVWNRLRSFLPDRVLHRVLTGAEFYEGERRDATILLADLTGYTTLSEAMDPEEIIELVNECFAFCVEIVYRNGGIIDKFMGDAVMAIFGVPVAHVDDAARAVRSALEIRERMEAWNAARAARRPDHRPLSFSFGIATGLVVAGTLGTDRRREYTVIGDTVNLAARLETVAQPNQIVVSDETRRRAEDDFEWASLGEIRVKGKSQPVVVHEVRTIRADRAPRPRTPTAIPFVGRTGELESLEGAYRLADAGASNLVLLRGDLGSGRSRLGMEFLERAAAAGARTYRHRAGARGIETPLQSFRLLLCEALGVTRDDPSVPVATRLRGALESAPERLPPDAIERVVRLYESEEEEEVPSAESRRTLVAALGRLLRWISRERPLVALFENAHLLDPLSVDVVAAVCDPEAEEPGRVLFLATVERGPLGALERAVAGLLSGGRVFEITLGGLGREEIAALCRERLGGNLPAVWVDRIHARTGGNPFFVLETLSALEARGLFRRGPAGLLEVAEEVADEDLPSSVSKALQSRLDRLDDSALRVLKHASIQGLEVHRRILSATTLLDEVSLRHYLSVASGEGILRPLDDSREAFAHDAYRTVLYEGLLRRHRRDLHDRVARAVEALFGDDLEGFVEILAYHHTRAGNAVPAARYLDLAARRAVRCHAYETAGALRREALDLLEREAPGGEEERNRLLYLHATALAAMHLALGEFAEAEAALARTAGIEGPRALRREAALLEGELAFRRGRFAESLAALDRARSLSEGGRERAEVEERIARTLRAEGRTQEAIERLEEARRIGPGAGAEGETGQALADALLAEAHEALRKGEGSRAAEVFLRAAALLAEMGRDRDALSVRKRAAGALQSEGVRALAAGDRDRARDLLARALEIERAIGDPRRIRMVEGYLEKAAVPPAVSGGSPA